MPFERVRAIILLLISIFGCCGNALTIVVVNQHFFRRTTTAAFITAVSIADFFVLFLQSYQILTKLYSRTLNSYDCTMFYFADVFRLLSVWVIAVMNLERCSLVFNPFHLPRLRSVVKARIFVCLLFCLSLLVFIHYAYFMKTQYIYDTISQTSNESLIVNLNTTHNYYSTYNDSKINLLIDKSLPMRSFCSFYRQFNQLIWEYVKSSLTYWTTTPIVIICNCIIIFQLEKAFRIEKRMTSNELKCTTKLSTKQQIMTVMLLSSSVLFVLTSTPATVHSIYLLATKNRSNTQYIIHIITNILLHLHHASNFLVYLFSCRRFRTEMMKLCNIYFKCQIEKIGRHRSTDPIYSTKPKTVVRLLAPIKSRRINYNRDIVTKKRIVFRSIPQSIR
ncbi:unnamed protein product [Didymodactylos carnosus]|uniref:G-protein coupled receptors family 1 profile domain-containing protein n=1 Tax=Didymodactylos carnosus TaxID=1234261 RepID=A0A8S2ET72_9BILA|nr:unnamed protein product [Didymodactylos carnosus]CAF4039664.1 unnamed protein product [Didymodactylos carnosus]